VEAMLAEHKGLRTRLEAAETELREVWIEAWAAEASPGPFVRVLEEDRVSWLSPMAGALAERRGEPVLLASSEQEEARVALAVPPGSDVHAGQMLRAFLDPCAGRGGGSPHLAQGKLPRSALPGLLERWREKGLAP
jgi:alanyl-tRNA synthetase